MNGVMRKPPCLPQRGERRGLEALRIIRINGFVAREANGDLWVSTGDHIPQTAFKWLLDRGLIHPRGDSLFGGPSQTYIPTEDTHVPENSAPAPADSPG